MKSPTFHPTRFPWIAAPAAGTLLAFGLLAFSDAGVWHVHAAGFLSEAAPGAVSAEAAESAAEKLDQIRQAASARSAPAGVRFTEEEINSYLYYDLASRYPTGVSKVNVRLSSGSIAGSTEIDFDKLKAARSGSGQPPGQSPGILGYLFWGVHTLAVEGAFWATDGAGRFELSAVSLDGVPLPRPLVDFLIDSYLKPRYPVLDLDRPFPLPYSIDRVEVRSGSVEATKKAAGSL
jgi:hypothetical protein